MIISDHSTARYCKAHPLRQKTLVTYLSQHVAVTNDPVFLMVLLDRTGSDHVQLCAGRRPVET